MSDKRQKNQLQLALAFTGEGRSEAPIRSDFHDCSLIPSSIYRTAGCGPACPVVWQGRTGDRPPYADRA